jgi:hypothetical protein
MGLDIEDIIELTYLHFFSFDMALGTMAREVVGQFVRSLPPAQREDTLHFLVGIALRTEGFICE